MHCNGCIKVAWWRSCLHNIILQLEGCDNDLLTNFLDLGASNFLAFLFFVLQNRFFFTLVLRSGFGIVIPIVIMYKKISLCN